MRKVQIDSTTLLQEMSSTRTSAMLSATLPSSGMRRVFSLKEPGEVHLSFQDGALLSGIISVHSEALLTQKEQLLDALERMGVLQWSFSTQIARPFPQTSSLPETAPLPQFTDTPPSSIPRWTRPIPFFEDRLIRRVCLLIDGNRSIQRIAELSRVPTYKVTEIMKALRTTQQIGITSEAENTSRKVKVLFE